VKVPILVILALILASLACGQQIVMPTPQATPTPPPSASPSPVPTLTATPRATEAAADTAVVRAAMVNVRQSPGGDVIGQLIAGTDVLVIGCVDDWCEVETDDLTGFVFIGCLSISDRRCEAK
jgi:hypothetical protein